MKRSLIWATMALLFSLAACQSQPQVVEVAVTRTVSETVSKVNYEEEAEEVGESIQIQPTQIAAADGQAVELSSESVGQTANQPRTAERQQTRQRLIIKDGQMTIESENAGGAVTSVANLAAATGGYIISQRVWDQDGYTFATMQIGVPVTEFERAMEQIRKLGSVVQDTASGVDVTDEFVDLSSRLETLEITQERLQTFLSEAKKMDDIIKLNHELSKVEEQINTIRGRMNYLADRAAFSTITVQIDPIIPEPTPVPVPDPEPWTVGRTATTATRQLQNTTRSVVDGVVYMGIVCGPWLVLLGGALYLALAIWRRINRVSMVIERPRATVPASPEEDHQP